MAVFGGISSTGGKGNLAGGIISAFIIVCRVGLGQQNLHPTGYPSDPGTAADLRSSTSQRGGEIKRGFKGKKNA